MIALVEHNIDRIQDVCKKNNVKSLYVIGSAAGDERNLKPDSDVDFLFRFNKNEIEEEYADNYFSLLFTLQDMLSRKVDLVPEEKLRNPYFIQSISQNKQKIYESFVC